ncbi:FtsX-like permease family protein [Streptomyces sp. NPDC057638]|uniref:FtsX-like permease family protein n=1 Tax=Streptomyces sp. NPDC057638 TaxID=3346190 RepID=UPI0036919880
MRAIVRWAAADLRTHRGQAATLALATAGITAALLLSAALFQFAASPWERLFAETRGHHVWLRLDQNAAVHGLAELDGVREMSGPYRTLALTLQGSSRPASVDLREAGREDAVLGAARLLTGSRLSGGKKEIVLEQSTARALWVQPGDWLDVRTPGKPSPYRLRVVGIVATAETSFDDKRRGIGWASPATVSQYTDVTPVFHMAGLRLEDPRTVESVVRQVSASVEANHVKEVSNWREARNAAADDHRLLGLLLRVFGAGALLAAAAAVTGGVGGRVLGQLRDVSVLKAIGMTPAQTTVMFLLQHTALALAGVAAGTLAVRLVGPGVPGSIGEAMAHALALPGTIPAAAAVGAVTVVVIAAASAFAAWRAARVPPIPMARTARPAPRRMSRMARAALGRGVPPPLVLGWRGAVHRRRRFLARVARLALPIMMITVALSAVATLNSLSGDGGGSGRLSPTPSLNTAGTLDARALDGLAAHRDVRALYPAVEVPALLPAQSRSVTLRGLGTTELPYPFTVVEGRTPAAVHEAVAGQGLLDAAQIRIGAWVRLTVGATPHVLHVVGRTIEPQHAGLTISATLDTLRDDGTAKNAQPYALLLRPGADPDRVKGDLEAAFPSADFHRTPAPDGSTGSAGPISRVLGALVAVLALIAVAELAASVSSAVWVHSRELSALRAIGLTPRQLVGVVVTDCALTAGAAALLGTVVGVLVAGPLIDAQGAASGVGTGLALTPGPFPLLLTALGLVLASAALALVPAIRAERRSAPDPGLTPR